MAKRQAPAASGRRRVASVLALHRRGNPLSGGKGAKKALAFHKRSGGTRTMTGAPAPARTRARAQRAVTVASKGQAAKVAKRVVRRTPLGGGGLLVDKTGRIHTRGGRLAGAVKGARRKR